MPLYFCLEGTILFAGRKFFYSPSAENVKPNKKLTLNNRGGTNAVSALCVTSVVEPALGAAAGLVR